MSHESTVHDYKDLVVWQKSVDLSVLIYQVTSTFPTSERYGIVDQMRRAAVSIPSNIAEGGGRKLRSQDHYHFLRIAYGSAQELETQLIISNKLNFLTKENCSRCLSLLTEVLKMLFVLFF